MPNKAEQIRDLKAKGYNNDEIAYKLGYRNTNYVRKVLSINKVKMVDILEEDINFLRKKLNIPAKVAKNILELKHFLANNQVNTAKNAKADLPKILELLENLMEK